MNRIYVALDTPSIERARALAEQVKAMAGGVKLGLEFFSANGPAGVASILELGVPVFLDLKLHDIPNTVGKAVEALGYQSGAAFGPAAMTLVGQNLGAGRPRQAAHSGWTAWGLGLAVMSAMAVVFFA